VIKKLRGSFLLGIGYMLSPLSWWNDLFFNLPIALLFGYLVSWINPDWFLPFTIVGYWLSNVLGIVMMQMGAMDMFLGQEERNPKTTRSSRDTLSFCQSGRTGTTDADLRCD